jgi:hypothetical protein
MSLNTINTTTISSTSKLQAGNATTNGGFQGDQWASELHGRFYTLAYNGMLFIQDSDSVTLAAANTTKGAAGTIKLINGFLNPAGSGVNAEIIATVTTFTSGTPTGAIVYNAQTLPPGIGLTNVATGTIRSSIINTISPGISKMTAETGVVIARSDSATTAFTQVGVQGGPAAVAAGAGLYSVLDECAGRYIIPPGTIFGLAQVGASTALVQTTMFWSEIAI